jgi:hypothetical protein
MFDPDIINEIAREGFKLIVQSGVLDKQLDRLKERMAFGNPDESDESLVESIKEFRRQYGMIESLRSLGEGYLEENTQ